MHADDKTDMLGIELHKMNELNLKFVGTSSSDSSDYYISYYVTIGLCWWQALKEALVSKFRARQQHGFI
jgi:hypothetical protein